MRSRRSKDEIAQFLTKTKQKKCNETQKVLLDGCHLLFDEYLSARFNIVYILKPFRNNRQLF